MQAGKHEATIQDYGVSESKAGVPQIVVKFKLTESNEMITWYGSLSTKASKHTLKALITMGMKTADIEAINEGPFGGALDMDTPVVLDLEEEMYEGKKRVRIKWINKLGGGQFERLSKEAAAKKLGGFKADLATMLIESGVSFNSNEEVPF